MKITIITVGRLKEKYLTMAIEEYSKRLSRYCKLSIIELADEKAPERLSALQEKEIKSKEGMKIISKIPSNAYVFALAIEGQQKTSEELAQNIKKIAVNSCGHIVFIIGGSLGLSEEVINMSNEQLSFSKMTFTHQLMRVILLEQVYRSYKILNNEPYHK